MPFRYKHGQDILIEALKGALILAVLERFYITRNSSWLEVRTHTRATLSTVRASC